MGVCVEFFQGAETSLEPTTTLGPAGRFFAHEQVEKA
jgi:hypothetical protein